MVKNPEDFAMDPDDFAEMEQVFEDVFTQRRDPSRAGSWPVVPEQSALRPGETVEEAHRRIQAEKKDAGNAD